MTICNMRELRGCEPTGGEREVSAELAGDLEQAEDPDRVARFLPVGPELAIEPDRARAEPESRTERLGVEPGLERAVAGTALPARADPGAELDISGGRCREQQHGDRDGSTHATRVALAVAGGYFLAAIARRVVLARPTRSTIVAPVAPISAIPMPSRR